MKRSLRVLSLVVLFAGVSMTSSAAGVEIIGHRGASHDAPENTLSSVHLAWEQNADAVEIDIYLTKDGRIVAFHDKTTERIGGRDKPVADQTLEELRTLDVGSWKDDRFKGEQIPTLAEIVDTVPDGKRLFIEVKCDRKVIPQLGRVLGSSGKRPEQTAVIGFSLPTMKAVKMALPELQVYWVLHRKQHKVTGRWSPSAETLVLKARRAGVDGIDVGALDTVDRPFIDKIKKSGLGFYCWTINSPDEANRLVRIGVDGITTDRPAFLRKHLAGQSE